MSAHNKTGKIKCQLTHKEIAELLTARGHPMTAKVVWHLERQALRKLASNPSMRRLAKELGMANSD